MLLYISGDLSYHSASGPTRKTLPNSAGGKFEIRLNMLKGNGGREFPRTISLFPLDDLVATSLWTPQFTHKMELKGYSTSFVQRVQRLVAFFGQI